MIDNVSSFFNYINIFCCPTASKLCFSMKIFNFLDEDDNRAEVDEDSDDIMNEQLVSNLYMSQRRKPTVIDENVEED